MQVEGDVIGTLCEINAYACSKDAYKWLHVEGCKQFWCSKNLPLLYVDPSLFS